MTGMDDLIRTVTSQFVRDDIPEFRPGDIIRLYERISEGARERLQPFEGLCLRSRARG